jgi:protoporphyrinogen oxidase
MNIILGGGLAGLSAAHLLSKSSAQVTVIEEDRSVGGLAKTIEHNGFRFDLGGHRFITRDRKIEQFVSDILHGEYHTVSRKSHIYMFGKYFDYPLKPGNAIFGLGLGTTFSILVDYLKATVKNVIAPTEIKSLEDWVVSRFGRKMFDIYFMGYSEKVWGMDSGLISQEWVSQRIKGLSMWSAVKNAFFNFTGGDIDTLADSFLYPKRGIGEISENLKNSLGEGCRILNGTKVERIFHENLSVRCVTARIGSEQVEVEGSEFVSTIPLTELAGMLSPAPPDDVLEAVSKLKFRDLVVVTVMLDRPKVTDLTWMYLPEKDIPIGRIHEPNNWSSLMSPKGTTSIVAEYFCNRGDDMWETGNEELSKRTTDFLQSLGFIEKGDFIGSRVVRVPFAYPVLDVGYRENYLKVMDYLGNFSNLHLAGRSGTFRYLNMDSAIESGLSAAETILEKGPSIREENLIPV